MFHSSNHQPNVSATCGPNLLRLAATLLRPCKFLSIAIALSASHAIAVDPQTAPPAAPRNATPFVRPTQYHLLPPIYRPQVDRVPTVEDLVPVLDDSSAFQFISGPASSTSRRSATNNRSAGDWPYTEASHGRHSSSDVSGLPPVIGAFRPARIPSKYASEISQPQQAPQQQQQQSHIQQVQHQRSNSVSPGEDFAPALFQAVESPFVNQPVQHILSPVWENEVSEAAQWQQNSAVTGRLETQPSAFKIRQASASDHYPIPDPIMATTPNAQGQAFPADINPSSNNSTSMPMPSSLEMSAPYEHEVHAPSCECDLCQNGSFTNSATMFGPTATTIAATTITAERQTRFRLDGLAWLTNSSSLPSLATSSAAGTVRNDAGVLGNPNTRSLFSDDPFSSSVPGFRIQMDHDLAGYGGIDFELIQLATRSENMFVSSANFPILARPFFDVSTGNSAANVIAFPGESTGAIQVAMDSRFRTAAVHYYQLAMEAGSKSNNDELIAKLQIGPRIATLQETLFSNDHSFDIVNNTSLQRTDALKVENLFVGGEVGLELNRRFQYVDLTAGVSIAAGANRQKFQSNGQSVLTNPTGQTSISDSGWLNTSVGSGDIKKNEFSVIPAAELGIGFQTKWGWKLSFGYNVMLWTNALRVTDQVPTRLDPTFGAGAVGGAVRPFSSAKDDSYLAHGISFGIERRW